MWVSLAWRLFWRELRRGELWLIGLALTLAVFTVVSLTGITDSVRTALSQRSANFIAADRVLRSSLPFNPAILTQAAALGLQSAQQLQFNTMVFAGDQMQLVSVKAVNDAYPLRGELVLQSSSTDSQTSLKQRAGEVFVEARLLALLQLKAGDLLDVGAAQLRIGGVIQTEPDAPMSVFGGQPRLLMHLADVPQTRVVQPGSRLSYRYLFAGDVKALNQLESQIEPLLTPQDRWQKLDRSSAIGGALDRAEQFLLLAGLLGIVLAACAAAVAANRFGQRHMMAVAIMKALGVTRQLARKIYLSQLALMTLLSIVAGITLGMLAILATETALSQWLEGYQPTMSWRPAMLGLVTALICSLLFSALPVIQLAATPAIHVLRAGAASTQFNVKHLMTGGFAVWLLMWLFSQDLWLASILFLACGIFAVVMMLLAALLVKMAKPMAAGQSSALRLALANLRRRLWTNSFQLITFSLALFLTLLLYFLRAELITQWQQQVPAGAPNHFLVNIASPEREKISDLLGLQLVFYPMTAGRVLSVNQVALLEPDQDRVDPAPTDQNNAKNPNQRQGFGRELNLTWLADLPDNNKLVAGQWFEPKSRGEVSVEEKTAERLALKLGDEIGFSIGGQPFSAKVSSFRQVDWNSLQPNFYMILSPDLMADIPATYLTAVYISAMEQAKLIQLTRQFPTVSVISVEQILQQINEIIQQVSLALTAILILVFAAAVLVLLAQVQASLEQRQQELAILRTLGANSGFLRRALLFEFASLGALAGIFATMLAELVLAGIQLRLFQLPFELHWYLWWIGPLLGSLMVSALGGWRVRHLLRSNTSELLRRVMT